MTISGASNSSSESQAAVSLLFSAGARPTADAIGALAAGQGDFSLSFDPASADTRASPDVHWVELLANGLTFDLKGLVPGPPMRAPPHRHTIALDLDELGPLEALTLYPGPHLAGGSAMMPVIRTLARLGARLSQLDGACALAWHPSRCWSAPELFRDAIDRWVEGGVFPGLTLTSLSLSPDKGMQSEGLALFIGQELRLEPELVEEPATAAKLAVRLIDHLIERGRVERGETLVGPDGRKLRLEPSDNGLFVRVWRG